MNTTNEWFFKQVEENLKPTNVEGPDVSNSLFIARPATSTGLEYQTKFRIDDFAIFYRFMTDQEVQGILFEGLFFTLSSSIEMI